MSLETLDSSRPPPPPRPSSPPSSFLLFFSALQGWWRQRRWLQEVRIHSRSLLSIAPLLPSLTSSLPAFLLQCDPLPHSLRPHARRWLHSSRRHGNEILLSLLRKRLLPVRVSSNSPPLRLNELERTNGTKLITSPPFFTDPTAPSSIDFLLLLTFSPTPLSTASLGTSTPTTETIWVGLDRSGGSIGREFELSSLCFLLPFVDASRFFSPGS